MTDMTEKTIEERMTRIEVAFQTLLLGLTSVIEDAFQDLHGLYQQKSADAAPQTTAPDGMVLVPRFPTDAMIAAFKSYQNFGVGYEAMLSAVVPNAASQTDMVMVRRDDLSHLVFQHEIDAPAEPVVIQQLKQALSDAAPREPSTGGKEVQ